MAELRDIDVAFLGPKASYTHQAALNHFPSDRYTLGPQTTIEDVFSTVQLGTVSHGVVPFENSSNGSVIFTLDLFADAAGKYPDILVQDEIYLPVHHCLVAHARYDSTRHSPSLAKRHLGDSGSGTATPTQAQPSPQLPRVKPSRDLSRIQKLYSHPQAWGQCKIFLSAYLKGIERQDVSSTSRAAELVANDESGMSAAISSRIASELNGLHLLAEGVEDVEGNSTRFFVIGRRDVDGSGGGETDGKNEEQPRTKYKTLVSFTVRHTEPGALADCLAVFKRHNLNLTSINTRPSGEAPWHYIFFVEFMGRKRHQGDAVNQALDELDQVAQSWRWLGSWRNALES